MSKLTSLDMQIPNRIYDKGMLYVETDKIQLVRRIGR